MNCRELSEFLSDFVAGDLAADVSREFDAHLARCPECHAFVAQYRATIRLSSSAFEESVGALPEDLVRAILSSVAKARGGDR
jgi:anti-sigma factor RsiW